MIKQNMTDIEEKANKIERVRQVMLDIIANPNKLKLKNKLTKNNN
jgi:ATP-dependent protease ClpP protease subunit